RAFICYAREDKTFVDDHIRPILKALNVDTWIDTEDLHGAERWRDVIQRALPDCDYFLVVATTPAAASPPVRGEVQWILRHRPDRLIPILAGRVRFDGVHPDLPHIQHVDCVGKTKGQSATAIARALVHLADRTAKTQAEKARELAAELERKQEE